jgi:DNA-binding LacI/PurR family transcriptional regulator
MFQMMTFWQLTNAAGVYRIIYANDCTDSKRVMNNGNKMAVTIIDVAKEANVSASTVSRVLNNKSTISENTVRRVYEAAERLGYEPNILAQSFRKQETRTILILTPNMTNPYYSNILSGISDTTRSLFYSSFICKTDWNREEMSNILGMMKKRHADGAILLACEMGEEDWLLRYAKDNPIILCSEFNPDTSIPHISIDNYKATVEAIEYLISLGHTKIGTISSVNKYLSTQLRLKGYKDALAAAGIEFHPEYVEYASKDYSYRSGCASARKLLSLEDRPTAIFCISDVLAIGAINTAAEMGIKVPEDLSVIGFDDVEQTAMFSPKLTTVAQPCYELGKKSAELLITAFNQSEDVPLETVLPYQLILRESTGSPVKIKEESI